VAVAQDARGVGIGMLVVAAALRQVARSGASDVYLVTTDAEGFFTRCGFRTIPREELPDSVAGHRQITRECPSSAPVMRLTLPAPLAAQ
ncbi:MAG: GNAT family N-acetyltransferase, partial [Actinomycetota bacterium]